METMKKYLPFIASIQFILILGLGFHLYRSTVSSHKNVPSIVGDIAYDWEMWEEELPEAFRNLQNNLDYAVAERARLEEFLMQGDAEFSVMRQTYVERLSARFNNVLTSTGIDALAKETDDLSIIFYALQAQYWEVYAELAATRDELSGTPMPGREP